ncbi:hypothetical protein ACFVYG_08535 [Streptomyces sp. NPDC058256]|uniref:hypothetical protein n=1 Tax=Streptomyces sp. NPDC058256 TaxID=3346408 RepID=UPI0036E626D1
MAEPRLRVTDAVGESWDDPSDAQIQRLFAGLNLSCPFLTMVRLDVPNDSQHYLQVALNDDLTMVLEYRDGGPAAHYRAEVPLQAEYGGEEIVVPVLLDWAARRPEWRGTLPWQQWDASREAPWQG